MSEIIAINKIELASELAHEKLLALVHLSNGKFEIYKETNEEVNYTEEAQDKFNEYYDYYLDMIQKTSINNN